MLDADLRSRLGKAAKDRSAEFDVSSTVSTLESIYRRALVNEGSVSGTPRIPRPAKEKRPTGLDIRPAIPGDREAIIDLCKVSLAWTDDERYARLFEWKHDLNHFGPSYMWVATDSGRVVGLRAFMRWQFVRGDDVITAVRAVDTATHPDYQGRGLFTAMTLHALEEVRADGIGFVFNTPNSQSLPGYLKMGWKVVGQLPISLHLRNPLAARRVLRSRVPASHWPVSTSVGVPVPDASADWCTQDVNVGRNVRLLRTRTSPEFINWRYGAEFLGYRAVPTAHGHIIARARQRGDGLELAVVESSDESLDAVDHAASATERAICATHTLRLGRSDLRRGFVPVPRMGPIFTWRAANLVGQPPLANWRLSLGDVELF
jgi:GNAT superfamily N-acetyltransferase